VSTAKTIKEHKDSKRAYLKKQKDTTRIRLRRREDLKSIEEVERQLKAEGEKFLDSLAPEERSRSKPIRKLREHIKRHRGKSAKSSQEKPGGGYKGEECLEEDDPNDPNDPSECV